MPFKNNQIGHFLTYEHWEDALGLLELQINQIGNNRHYNELSMFYYESLTGREKLNTQEYFEERVANNLFYGLKDEFSISTYLRPKAGLGLRKFKFMTYPMRSIYYSIGIYLLNVCNEFILKRNDRNKNVFSYYGGNLTLEKGRLKPSKKSIYYWNYYFDFRKKLRQETAFKIEDGEIVDESKYILRLDIQNYFDELSISKLLQLIDDHVSESTKSQFNYNHHTMQQIENFYLYVANGQGGIPQTDNDPVSSFLGFLYLLFADMEIDKILQDDFKSVDDYRIIRYVDDIYIVLNFSIPTQYINMGISFLGSQVADKLYEDFSLKLNPKTRIFNLRSQESRTEFLNTVKHISPGYYISDDDDDIDSKIQMIFSALEELKVVQLVENFDSDKSLQDEILKGVFDKRVYAKLGKHEYVEQINELFSGADFDFHLVKASPMEIIIIILKSEKITGLFEEYLMRLDYISTWEVEMILRYLCQTSFKNKILLEKLKSNPFMKPIVEAFLNPDLHLDNPGLYGLPYRVLKTIQNEYQIIEQIQLRVLSEKTNNFSLSLNHLLNEIHAICYLLYLEERVKNNLQISLIEQKEYSVNHVVDLLLSKKVSQVTISQIENLFDRRNHNGISHPNSRGYTMNPVSSTEYLKFFNIAKSCLRYLLK